MCMLFATARHRNCVLLSVTGVIGAGCMGGTLQAHWQHVWVCGLQLDGLCMVVGGGWCECA
jgi:hypothetical protein